MTGVDAQSHVLVSLSLAALLYLPIKTSMMLMMASSNGASTVWMDHVYSKATVRVMIRPMLASRLNMPRTVAIMN